MQENHEPVAKRMKTQEAPSFYAQVKSNLDRDIFYSFWNSIKFSFSFRHRNLWFLRKCSVFINNFDDKMSSAFLFFFSFDFLFCLSDINKQQSNRFAGEQIERSSPKREIFGRSFICFFDENRFDRKNVREISFRRFFSQQTVPEEKRIISSREKTFFFIRKKIWLHYGSNLFDRELFLHGNRKRNQFQTAVCFER